jgi:hypothetical protein
LNKPGGLTSRDEMIREEGYPLWGEKFIKYCKISTFLTADGFGVENCE